MHSSTLFFVVFIIWLEGKLYIVYCIRLTIRRRRFIFRNGDCLKMQYNPEMCAKAFNMKLFRYHLEAFPNHRTPFCVPSTFRCTILELSLGAVNPLHPLCAETVLLLFLFFLTHIFNRVNRNVIDPLYTCQEENNFVYVFFAFRV